MYIRPQLSRKRTGDREILLNEHNADVTTYKQSLEVGKDYEGDIAKVTMMINAISQNDNVADEDKKPILDQLNQLLCELQKEYSSRVDSKLADIEFSMQDRINEMQAATRVQESEVFYTETIVWRTNAVDKDKLVAE